jgi:hypothetical protein
MCSQCAATQLESPVGRDGPGALTGLGAFAHCTMQTLKLALWPLLGSLSPVCLEDGAQAKGSQACSPYIWVVGVAPTLGWASLPRLMTEQGLLNLPSRGKEILLDVSIENRYSFALF